MGFLQKLGFRVQQRNEKWVYVSLGLLVLAYLFFTKKVLISSASLIGDFVNELGLGWVLLGLFVLVIIKVPSIGNAVGNLMILFGIVGFVFAVAGSPWFLGDDAITLLSVAGGLGVKAISYFSSKK